MQSVKEIKCTLIRKEETKVVYADDMIIYIENLNEATKQLLELINFRKIIGYKITIQKVIISLILAASL